MEDKIKFPANVILIDVAFLNEVVYGAKNFLEGKLGRKLPDVDLPAWLSYLALDAGLREQENEVEVLLVHTPAADVLKCCEPSDVNKLNHQACRTPLGEFAFSSVTSSNENPCVRIRSINSGVKCRPAVVAATEPSNFE